MRSCCSRTIKFQLCKIGCNVLIVNNTVLYTYTFVKRIGSCYAFFTTIKKSLIHSKTVYIHANLVVPLKIKGILQQLHLLVYWHLLYELVVRKVNVLNCKTHHEMQQHIVISTQDPEAYGPCFEPLLPNILSSVSLICYYPLWALLSHLERWEQWQVDHMFVTMVNNILYTKWSAMHLVAY